MPDSAKCKPRLIKVEGLTRTRVTGTFYRVGLVRLKGAWVSQLWPIGSRLVVRPILRNDEYVLEISNQQEAHA